VGSFRVIVFLPNLHGNLYFTKVFDETAPRSLHYSCKTAINCQGISLHYDRYSYNRRLPRLIGLSTIRLVAPDKCQSKYFELNSLLWPVFLVNIRQGLLSVSYVIKLTLIYKKPSLSRSYGVILPSSLSKIPLNFLVH